MIKPDVIEKFFDGCPLHIGATRRNFPIAMSMCLLVAHDYLTKSPSPCLRGSTFLTNQAGNEQLFEVGGSHES